MRLLPGQGGAGPVGDHAALLLGEGRIDVQHERVRVGAKLGHDEGHPLRHQPGDKRHVAGQAVPLGHHDRSLGFAGGGQSGGKVRLAVSVGNFPSVSRISGQVGVDPRRARRRAGPLRPGLCQHAARHAVVDVKLPGDAMVPTVHFSA